MNVIRRDEVISGIDAKDCVLMYICDFVVRVSPHEPLSSSAFCYRCVGLFIYSFDLKFIKYQLEQTSRTCMLIGMMPTELFFFFFFFDEILNLSILQASVFLISKRSKYNHWVILPK